MLLFKRDENGNTNIFNYGQIFHINGFDWKPAGMMSFDVMTDFYLQKDANIDFYDTEVSVLMAGVLVRF